ncbi:sterile alpha motif domain-containing protein 9-like [Lytechinus pictus]|uniref:sterile alpha motif domain-containing protein 9-like n=1 Tax=Lytechinus pictus TaxID=7653 RepID=UPI0030B9FA9A
MSLFEQQGALLSKAQFDSIHFFVRIMVGPNKDAFIQACTDRNSTLFQGLTSLLVTPELEEAAGIRIRLRLAVKDTPAKDVLSAPKEYSPVPFKTLPEMSTDEVKKWLIEEVRISISIADKLAEACVDGELLLRYEDQHLQKDFQLPTGVMRKIMYARDDHMKKRAHAQALLAPASECSDNLNKGAGSTGNVHRSPSSAGTQESESNAQITELTASVKKLNAQDGDLLGKSVAVEMSQPAPLSKEEESAREATLRYLLTGDENGSLDSSFHPILVVNKESCGGKSESLEDRLGFVSLVNWNAVFDCNSNSIQNGVCSMVERKREIKLLLPETFNKETSPEEVDFNDVPSWIFANGRDDLEELQSPSLASDWNEKYGAGVDRAIDFFAMNAIPKERAVIVFLLLSRDSVQVMSDIFKKLQSSLQGHGTFTFIAESRKLFEVWADEVKKWLPRDQLEKRSFIGTSWKRVNCFFQKQFGKFAIFPAELPLSDGKTCILPDKKRSQWLNIDVLPSNECENTALEEEGPEFQKFVSEQELAFYQGNPVSWWNFHLTEGRGKRQQFNQVLRRKVSKSLNTLVKSKLVPPNPNDGSGSIVTITIFHEPGSGASTAAKQVLWDFHRQFRCIIVQRAVLPTVDEILQVCHYGYESLGKAPPVLVLFDDADDAEVIDLIAQLEVATNNRDSLSIIMLHCKRTPDPELEAKDNGMNSVVIEHKLDDRERKWFDDKFKEYDEEYSLSPEKLIGFMVMKEECNPDYIRRIVSNILPEVEGNETRLLKYMAVINMFMGDFGMPVSCCDEFMNVGRKVEISRGRYKLQYVPWENLLSHATCLLLVPTRVHTRSGPTKAIKLVNPVLATEVVKQIVEDSGQSIGDIVRELIHHSRILDSRAYTKMYLIDKIRGLLVRRRKIANDWSEQSQFSPLIEHILTENPSLAFQLLEETSELFKNGHIAQQLARLYKWHGDLVEAARCAKMATDFQSDNPYYWDTRGRIAIDVMKSYKKKYNETPLDESDAFQLMNLLHEGMDVFKRCQDLLRVEYNQFSTYAGYSGELKVIFQFLHIMEERVVPFCLSSRHCVQQLKVYFLTDEELQGLSEFWKQHRHNLKELPKRADLTLHSIEDLMTFSKSITRTKQNPEDELRMRKTEKNKFYLDMLRYFTVDIEQSPPKSVQVNPVSMNEWRRAQVRTLNADSFFSIFKLAQHGQVDPLKKVQGILNANHPKNSFDLKILVCLSFALSSLDHEEVDYNGIIRQVQNLNEIDHSLYGAFFALMLAWPRDDPNARSSDVGMTTLKAIVILREKWDNLLRMNSEKQSSQTRYDKSLPRSNIIVRKPLTQFLLAQGEGLRAFVHINMFNATQSTLEGEKHRFWSREEVKERMLRLEGTIQDRERIVYITPAKEIIYIRLSARWHCQPSQEKVSFYLGFNFLGPVAYDVCEKDRKPVPILVKTHHQTYPGYLLGRLSNLERRKEGIQTTLDEIEYLSKKRRNRQKLTVDDLTLIRTKPKLDAELLDIEAQIQDELDKNDDEDETFTLVTKRKRGYKVMSIES